MRDWTLLRPASFRGVPFRVDVDQPEGGRRVVVHEISGGESNPTEDMGLRGGRIYVDAYLAGDFADMAGLALEAACDAPGPGLLVLPIDLPKMVHCEFHARDRRKDQNGMIRYQLEFVPWAPLTGGLPSGLGALRGVFVAGVAAAAASLAGLF